MNNYHVHVYRVQAMTEVDLKAETPEEAKQKAVEKIKSENALMRPADCGFIALAFKSEEPE